MISAGCRMRWVLSPPSPTGFLTLSPRQGANISPFGPGAEFFTMRSIFHHNSAELFFMVAQNVKNAPCGAWELRLWRILDFECRVYDIGGLSRALGSVTAVSDGVLLCYHLCRRFRRCAAAPPSIHLVALRALKFGEPVVRGKTMGTCERMRAEFSSPKGDSR